MSKFLFSNYLFYESFFGVATVLLIYYFLPDFFLLFVHLSTIYFYLALLYAFLNLCSKRSKINLKMMLGGIDMKFYEIIICITFIFLALLVWFTNILDLFPFLKPVIVIFCIGSFYYNVIFPRNKDMDIK